jgi:hypothetical protein
MWDCVSPARDFLGVDIALRSLFEHYAGRWETSVINVSTRGSKIWCCVHVLGNFLIEVVSFGESMSL